MKFKILFISLCLFALYVLLGCSQQDAENEVQQTQTNFERAETEKNIDKLKEKYNAIDFITGTDDCIFSVDAVDMYKDKNLFAMIWGIDDVIYIENDMYMYAEEPFGDNQFLLKITEEQYSKIKTFDAVANPDDYYFSSTLCIVFSLDNIEAEFSALDAWFDFSLGADNTLADYDLYNSVYSKIIRGTLIDIVEVTE